MNRRCARVRATDAQDFPVLEYGVQVLYRSLNPIRWHYHVHLPRELKFACKDVLRLQCALLLAQAKAEGAHAALDITIDLLILADSDYFIGTCTSSVSLLAGATHCHCPPPALLAECRRRPHDHGKGSKEPRESSSGAILFVTGQMMRARHIRQKDAGASHIWVKDLDHIGGLTTSSPDIVGQACFAHHVAYNNSFTATSAIEGADCIECGHGFGMG